MAAGEWSVLGTGDVTADSPGDEKHSTTSLVVGVGDIGIFVERDHCQVQILHPIGEFSISV